MDSFTAPHVATHISTVFIVHLFEPRFHPYYGKGSLRGPDTGHRRVPELRLGAWEPHGAWIWRWSGSPGKETAWWQIISDKELVCESWAPRKVQSRNLKIFHRICPSPANCLACDQESRFWLVTRLWPMNVIRMKYDVVCLSPLFLPPTTCWLPQIEWVWLIPAGSASTRLVPT